MKEFAFKVAGASLIIFAVAAVGTFYTAGRVAEHIASRVAGKA